MAYPDPTGPKIGDPVPNFALPDTSGTLRVVRTPEVAGQLALILFVGDPADEAAAAEIAACVEMADSFAAVGTRVFAVTSAEPAVNQSTLQPPAGLWVLGDVEQSVAADFGVGKAEDRALPVGFVVDRNSYVVGVVPKGDTPIAARALEIVQQPVHQPAGLDLASVAPVLWVPHVFEPAFCKALIELWASDNKETGTDNVVEATDDAPVFKLRRDHTVTNKTALQQIQRRLALRLLPEIEKVFFFKVTRQEALRIGRYDSARQAYFKPHRDNIPPNGHRRFAMTLNLNDDYTGGALRFPEYGPHFYRPGTGSAVVFPCSLIHEAMPVTEGNRFAMISFFFGEAEFEAYKAQRSTQH